MSLSFAQRCQHPRHHKMGPPLCPLEPFQVYGTIANKTLSDLSFTGQGAAQDTGLLDGCLEFFSGKSKSEVKMASLREIESYLRTDNHIPAFAPAPLNAWYNTIHTQLLRALEIADSPLVCTCFKVSYKTIEDELIQYLDLNALIAKYKISTGCGSCLKPGHKQRFAYLEEIYQDVSTKLTQGYYQSEEYRELDRRGLSSLKAEPSLLQKIRSTTALLQQSDSDLQLVDIQDWTLFVTDDPTRGNAAPKGIPKGTPRGISRETLELLKTNLKQEFQAPHIDIIKV